MSRPLAEVTVAHSFSRSRGVAGIAGTLRGGRVICVDIVRANSNLVAAALSVLRQVEITMHPHSAPATIFTGSELLLGCARGDVEPVGARARTLFADLAAKLDAAGDKITLGFAPKSGTRLAYIAANQGYKAWLAGRNGETDTWQPAPPESPIEGLAA